MVLTLAPVVRTRDHVPVEPVLRSISKPLSSADMSDQVRSTVDDDIAVAARFVGALGTVPPDDPPPPVLPASVRALRTAETHVLLAPPWLDGRRNEDPSV